MNKQLKETKGTWKKQLKDEFYLHFKDCPDEFRFLVQFIEDLFEDYAMLNDSDFKEGFKEAHKEKGKPLNEIDFKTKKSKYDLPEESLEHFLTVLSCIFQDYEDDHDDWDKADKHWKEARNYLEGYIEGVVEEQKIELIEKIEKLRHQDIEKYNIQSKLMSLGFNHCLDEIINLIKKQ